MSMPQIPSLHRYSSGKGDDKTMKKRIVEWLINQLIKLLPEQKHLHLNPTRKPTDFTAPPPEFSTEGGDNED
jgi:hypothetical protein